MTKHEVAGEMRMRCGSGRRQRPPGADGVVAKPSSSKSVSDAKANFVASVSRGVTVLMEEWGYSRERAQQTLLQEIAHSDPPADDEVSLVSERLLVSATLAMVLQIAQQR
jgi:hypothetical protein